MTTASAFLDHLTDQGFGPYGGVPCSFLSPFINYVIDSPVLDYLAANNEGEAIAMAAGVWLGGRRPVVMFQNSGLGNTVNPITSLLRTFRIPVLLIATWRGEPGHPDEPQHELMGRITQDMLDLMEVEHAPFPENDDAIVPAVSRAIERMDASERPYAFIMRKGAVNPYKLLKKPEDRSLTPTRVLPAGAEPEQLLLRQEILQVLSDAALPSTLMVATTGKTGRELFTVDDRPGNFYVVGSMGCASSIGLGIALNAPHSDVVVIDGDGAALMRLEAMAGVGFYRPSNFIHCLLDNRVHESTGGQPTLSSGISFPQVATACGYSSAVSVADPEDLVRHLKRARQEPGPHLMHVRIRPGSSPDLSRPSVAPWEVARRFRASIATAQASLLAGGSV